MTNEKAIIDNKKIAHVLQNLKYYLDGGLFD